MSPMQVLIGVIALIGVAAAGHNGNAFDDAASVLDNVFG